jgi:hypothetical protein
MVHFEALMGLVFLKPAGCNVNQVFLRRLPLQVTVGCGPLGRNRIEIFAALTASQTGNRCQSA